MRRLAYLIACSLVAMLVALPYAGAQSGDTVTVSIQDFFFEPAGLTVEQGTTVQWVNEGNAPHDVTSTDSGPLASGTVQNGQMYSFTFEQPGDYAYFCSIHPDMTASVTVIGDEDEADDSGATAASGSAAATADDSGAAQYADSDQYDDDAIAELPDTGGVPVLAFAALALAAGVLGLGALRRML